MRSTAATTARRDLRLLAGAAFLSAAGDFLAMVTLVLVVHDLSGSGLVVSAFLGATMVPVIALAPLAGLIADRFESVRVMAIASLAQCALAVGLAFSTDAIGAILVLTALLAAGSAISQPAEFALVPSLASGRELTKANGVMEAARYAGFAAGPVLAGVIAAVGNAQIAMLVNAATFLAIAAAAGLIRTRRPGRARADASASSDRARDGVATLLRDDVLRPTLVAAVGALLFISASLTIEVFYVQEVLDAGEVGYALVLSVWMVGMVVGATRLAPRVRPEALAFVALVALLVQGAGMASQTAWAVLPFAVIGYAIGGLGHGVKNTLLRTLIQARVPDRLHGRAFAAYNAARNAAELAALGAGGVLVSAIGARPALVIAGMGPVAAALLGLVALQRAGVRRPALARG